MKTRQDITQNKKSVLKQDNEGTSKRYAKASITASNMSAILADSFTKNIFPEMAIVDVASELSANIKDIQSGNMQSIEAMLVGQAQALQTMFVSLGRQAASKTQLAQYTAFMNLALKAQSQSRATIQALTELKYPKQATYVNQANIANGNQQVNNAKCTHAPTHAKAILNQPNELLSEINNAEMDNRRTATTNGTDKEMATVAT
jgi:hypothetical protein